MLKITKCGLDFINNPYTFMVVKDAEFSEDDDDEVGERQTAALDPELFAMLQDLRKDTSRKLGIPPYVIFRMFRSSRWLRYIRYLSKNW